MAQEQCLEGSSALELTSAVLIKKVCYIFLSRTRKIGLTSREYVKLLGRYVFQCVSFAIGTKCEVYWSRMSTHTWKFFARTVGGKFNYTREKTSSQGLTFFRNMRQPICEKEGTIFTECTGIEHLRIGNLYEIRNMNHQQTRINSVPSGSSFVACRAWGMPAGKYQRSPGPWNFLWESNSIKVRFSTYNVG